MSRIEDEKFAIEQILKGEPQAKIIQMLADKNHRAGKTRIDVEVDAEFTINDAWKTINARREKLKGATSCN